jgi:GrpB-like predicted nucleotidyltransferase (UPF0157 family)
MQTVKKTPIPLVPYDTNWPTLFEQERQRLAVLLGAFNAKMAHIGSTAIEGMIAKPTIDMMIGVEGFERSPECVANLQQSGYTYAPEFEKETPDRRLLFRNDGAGRRTHQMHVVAFGELFWKRHLVFRDYLRAHPQVAADYAALKQRLAIEFAGNPVGYTRAKSPFTYGVTSRAAKQWGNA